MKTLYFDCFAGASGNMILGGLIALGIDPLILKAELSKLNIPDFDLHVSKADRSGISSVHVDVQVPHEHAHRHLHHIESIISGSGLSASVKKRSIEIFTRLAQAEAKIHGTDITKVHFHEVGAMDAIIDITGACIGFEILGVECFAASKLHVGSGFVKMAHGTYPVPPPAVAELVKDVPIYATDIAGELLTPTGAAIITTLCSSFGPMAEIKAEAVGYGAGSRAYEDFPNVLRLIIGNSSRASEQPKDVLQERLILLETNIDDMAPQVLGYVMEKAIEEGALDCWFTPIQMKKDRPATLLSILCSVDKRESLCELLFRETTTLGIRVSEVERRYLEREITSVETGFGMVDVKIAKLRGEIVNAMPEYDQLKRIASENGISLNKLREDVIARANILRLSAGGH